MLEYDHNKKLTEVILLHINENYKKLEQSYLFSTIAKKVSAYSQANPDVKIIRLGIGDVTLPLGEVVVNAMKQAAQDQGVASSFHGYGPEQGYDFLREPIAGYYGQRGIQIDPAEIFVSDGAKSDTANILDIFSDDNVVLIPNPVYPVYQDTNVMTGHKILYMDANVENGFLPLPDSSVHTDIIYLCSPNNPTGAVYTKEMLQQWVDYANDHQAIILFDAAYEAFVVDPTLPRSIFEIPGARSCAIEFCSLSKTAGFTGTRCGYTIIPIELECDGMKLNAMWNRRQTTKFNGVSYIVQRGAQAVFTPEGMEQCMENLSYYRENAKIIADVLRQKDIWFVGGENSPYLWLKCPNGMKSWDFFDLLLEKHHIVGTPGSGFGSGGEGFFRLTAFGNRENTMEAAKRLSSL